MIGGALTRSSRVSNSGTTSMRETGRVRREIDQAGFAREEQHAQQIVGASSSSTRCTCWPRARRARPARRASVWNTSTVFARPRRAGCSRDEQRAAAEQLAAERFAIERAGPPTSAIAATRARVRLGVLAQVQVVAVEAERADLRDQRLDERSRARGRRRREISASPQEPRSAMSSAAWRYAP